jgi:hypothetical protein
VKLFQVEKQGSLWAVFAVSASDPNDRELVRNWTADEQFADDLATALNRIAATHEVEPDEATEVDPSTEPSTADPPIRGISFED